MENLLREFYLGNINPSERFTSAMRNESKVLNESMNKLVASLNDEQKELFEDMCNAQADYYSLVNYESFAYGFRLGVALMKEADM